MLEGLTGSGKTTLSERPFSIGAGKSVNIGIDQFCRQSIPLKGVRYFEAVDRAALRTAVRAALASASPVVVVEGPVAWPLIARIAGANLQRDCTRRVYLKRMMRLKPGLWVEVEYRQVGKQNQAHRVTVMRPVGGPDTSPDKEKPSKTSGSSSPR